MNLLQPPSIPTLNHTLSQLRSLLAAPTLDLSRIEWRIRQQPRLEALHYVQDQLPKTLSRVPCHYTKARACLLLEPSPFVIQTLEEIVLECTPLLHSSVSLFDGQHKLTLYKNRRANSAIASLDEQLERDRCVFEIKRPPKLVVSSRYQPHLHQDMLLSQVTDGQILLLSRVHIDVENSQERQSCHGVLRPHEVVAINWNLLPRIDAGRKKVLRKLYGGV